MDEKPEQLEPPKWFRLMGLVIMLCFVLVVIAFVTASLINYANNREWALMSFSAFLLILILVCIIVPLKQNGFKGFKKWLNKALNENVSDDEIKRGN